MQSQQSYLNEIMVVLILLENENHESSDDFISHR